MNLKPFVNDIKLWKAFTEELDERIKFVYKQMSQFDDPKDLYRCQGELKALSNLKKLRDKVNHGQ